MATATLAQAPVAAGSTTSEQDLVALIRRAVATCDEAEMIAILKNGMVAMAQSGRLAGIAFPPANPERYSRRLVFADAWNRFTVIAMTWGVGQRTPLHDHAGVWCVEVVADGEMEATSYELLEEDAAGVCRFERRQTLPAGPASSGALIPPFEHHTFGNIGATPSHTLHIYGGPMGWCDTFTPLADGRWQRQHRVLGYDC